MAKRLLTRSRWLMATGLAVGLSLGLGVFAGAVGGRYFAAKQSPLPAEFPLHALATHGNDKMVIATGPLGENMEALYTLDCVTGELRIYCISGRTRAFALGGSYNILGDLKVEKGKAPNFLIVTGGAQLLKQNTSAGTDFGQSIIYVCDATTGRFAAYGIAYNANTFKQGATTKAVIGLIGSDVAKVELGGS